MSGMEYLVIIEASETGFGAYAPDLPGCGAAGESKDEVLRLIREAIEFHIDGLRKAGEPVPQPTTQCATVNVHAA